MKLRELINRLEQLSKNGLNDDLEVVLKTEEWWQDYPQIKSAWIAQDPEYNFDESECGPVEWVELKVEEKMYETE